MFFRDFHQLGVDPEKGELLPFLKKDALSFLTDQKAPVLRATINATYSGYLLNRRVYPGRYLSQHDCYGDFCSKENGGTSSYDKPVLCHHDDHGEPIGRIVKSEFFKLMDGERFLDDFKNPAINYEQGSGLIQVVAVITDAEAIAKILDGRYNTVSTGQVSDHLWCSICGEDWKSSDHCTHLPGRKYQEEEDSDREVLCYGITGKLAYHEMSYVNIPANANAVTIATEMSDSWKGEKPDYVDHDRALNYAGMCLVDSAGNEVDLSNKDGEKLPATKTQVQVTSKIDFDKLGKTEVDMSDHGPYLSDEVFALGNTVLAMVSGEMLSDAPMSSMYSYFQAISKKAGGHQHIMYLEMDLGKRRIQGGTEFTDKGEYHHHSIDLEITDLNARTFSGETRDANKGDQHTHAFSFDMMDDHLEQVSLKDALECGLKVEKAILDKKLSKDQQGKVVLCKSTQGMLDEGVKTLSAGAFCGPNNTFPIPDCAHVTAARRLIGHAKLSADSKSKVLSAVIRHAAALGFGSTEDQTTADPYGMLTTQEETTMSEKNTEDAKTDEAKTPEDLLRGSFEALKDDALLDKAVELSLAIRVKDKSIVSLTTEKDALVEKNESVEAASKALADSNTGLREKLHLAKARELAVMRLVSGGLVVDSDEKFEEAVTKLAERTEESLGDAIKDSMGAFQKALSEKAPDSAAFLKDKPSEKDPVDKNTDLTNDKDALKALKEAKEEKKTPEARKVEASNSL